MSGRPGAGQHLRALQSPAGARVLIVQPDRTLRRLAPGVWSGGSPLRMFRLAGRGDELLTCLAEQGSWSPGGPAELRLCGRLLAAGAVHPLVDDSWSRGPVTPEVTVVVPVRDDTTGLGQLLDDLSCTGGTAAAQGADDHLTGAPRGALKVIVVDDGSVHHAAVARTAADAGATLVRHDTPRGPAAARNTGLARVETPLVAFVDADVRCEGSWLAVLAGHLRDPGPGDGPHLPAAPVVAAAPRVRSAPGKGRLAAYDRRRGPLDLGDVPAPVSPGTRVPYVPTAALLARTAAVRAIGGFDESLRFGEDVDLVWRLASTGATVRYEPAVEVRHRCRRGLASWTRQRFDYGTAAGELDRRHRGELAPVVMSPWSAAAWCAAASGHPVVGLFVAASSSVVLARRLGGVPARAAVGVALRGHLASGQQLARAVIRPWWPAALVASLVSKRARVMLATALAMRVLETPGPLSDRLLVLLDDASYSTGVWVGAARARRAGPLLPRVVRRA